MAVHLNVVTQSINGSMGDLKNGYTTIDVKHTFPASLFRTAGASFSPDITYALPLPKGTTDIFENAWEASAFQTAAGAFASGAPAEAVLQAGKGLISQTVGAGYNAIEEGAPQEVSNALSIKGGSLINPNTQLMYKTPTIRQLQFTWALTPASAEGAKIIYDMVKDFRKTSYPSYYYSGNLTYPGIFRITLHGMPGKIILLKSFPAALTSLQVNYDTENSPYIHIDGYPVTTTITLVFQELKILNKDDIEELYGK